MPMRRDVPVHRSGIKVRRQPIRRSTPRIRATQIYALVLMVLCLLTVISLGSSTVFAARRLEVYGARFTGEEAVRQIVGIDGSPNLFRLRTDRIAEALAALPAVESAQVDVRLPDTIVVTLVEREPRMIWVIGDRHYVVDDSGLLFGQVDSAGNPIYVAPGSSIAPNASATAATGTGAPGASASGTAPTGSPAASASGDATGPTPTAGPVGLIAPPNLTLANLTVVNPTPANPAAARVTAAKVTPRPTARITPKPTPKATPRATAKPTATPNPTTTLAPAPSILPVPTADPAASPGPQVVNVPIVYDRRSDDAGLGLGDAIDPIALDAAYRLAGLTPADVGSQAASLDVVIDDTYGFMVSPGSNSWVADFGFYTETLRKDTVIPEQVRDLRSLLLHSGENHVAWVFLVADIADNHVDTYIAR